LAHHLLPLLHLLLLRGLKSGFNALLSFNEGVFDLIGGWGGLLHPGVCHNLGHGRTVRWLNLEHTCYQLLELLGKEVFATCLVAGVRLPEDVCTVASDTLVVRVRHFCVGERWVLSNQNKENDSSSEDIYLLALVWGFQMDFWGHVVQGSKLSMEIALTIFSISWSGETEIGYFKVVIFIKQKIFWLQVSVGYLLVVAKVQTLHELLEEVSGFGLSKGARVGDEVEELATLGVLHDHIRHHFVGSVASFVVEGSPDF